MRWVWCSWVGFLLGISGQFLSANAQVSDTNLYSFQSDYEGWILQFVERHYEQGGQFEVRDYLPFTPEGWTDGTSYPLIPGDDQIGNGNGAMQLGLRLEGVWDAAQVEHRWSEAVYLQSEDLYTHQQSGWPAGYEQHPDYPGAWMFGHYGSIGTVAGSELHLRVYQPGFAHVFDPVLASIYTISGAGNPRVAADPCSLVHGWNRLSFPISALDDSTDLREIGVRLSSDHHIWGSAYVDQIGLDAAPLAEPRVIYISPDTTWFSTAASYDTARVSIRYDDGGAASPGLRGFHLVLEYPPECIQVTSVSAGDLMAGGPNHFEALIDDTAGELLIDWVVLGATDGIGGYGSMATITMTGVDPAQDCAGALSFDEGRCALRDPQNHSLTATFVGGAASCDLGAPPVPALTSGTHTPGNVTHATDLQVSWDTIHDTGASPVGMRGFFLLLDEDPNGVPFPRDAQYSWFAPWSPDSLIYTHWFSDLNDGTWYVHLLAADWLWNLSSVETFGPILIDTTPPDNVTGFDADITPDADLSVDLLWTNPTVDFAGLKIYRIGFGNYPEYDDPPSPGSVPDWPANPAEALAAGWVEIYNGTGAFLNDLPDVRDYYYYAAFAYDDAENYAAADSAARDESLAYWLGDFTLGGPLIVDIYDVLLFSLAYDTIEGDAAYNSICDIGPTVDYGRKSLPTTDNLIEFEDLMILGWNYENAHDRMRPPLESATQSIVADLSLTMEGDRLLVGVALSENPGDLLGASVKLSYGDGLEYLGVAAGELWPPGGSHFLVGTRDPNTLSLDAIALGATVAGDGTHAEVEFRVHALGQPATSAEEIGVIVTGLRARDSANRELAAPQSWSIAREPAGESLALRLVAAHPNPARRGTTLGYTLAAGGRTRLHIYDAAGRCVRTLVDEYQAPDHYRIWWNGCTARGEPVAPGIYFYRLHAGEGVLSGKVMVVR